MAPPTTGPRLRPAVAEDMQTLYQWRNDPWLVSLSKDQQRVTPEEHERWFRGVYDSPDHLLHIIQGSRGPEAPDEMQDVGAVRIDRHGLQRGQISIYIMRPHTGRGYGTAALRQAMVIAFDKWPDLRVLDAEIRHDNPVSRRLFERCGFRPGTSKAADKSGPAVSLMSFHRPPAQAG